MTVVKLLFLMLREWLSSPRLQRTPEPTAAMDDATQAEAFHRQGGDVLIPVYHFNALAVSRMVPAGGRVVDLGCGSGRFLAYLAERRPDIQIVGFDLSPTMVEIGNRFLAQRGLSGRIRICIGDMTGFSESIPGPVDLVSSVFSLHHLPDEEHLMACLREIRLLHERTGCALWIFDHARPRHPATPRLFSEIFTPPLAVSFRADSCNSLKASYRFDELCHWLGVVGLDTEHRLARWLNLYQIHWREKASSGRPAPWMDMALPVRAAGDYAAFRRLFPDVPLCD